jgi:hypothetical protein
MNEFNYSCSALYQCSSEVLCVCSSEVLRASDLVKYFVREL